VQAWADGQPNWGVAFLPQIIDGNDDGIEIATSEWGTIGQRPKLTVTFNPPTPHHHQSREISTATAWSTASTWG
jgi:hypothetical protein